MDTLSVLPYRQSLGNAPVYFLSPLLVFLSSHGSSCRAATAPPAFSAGGSTGCALRCAALTRRFSSQRGEFYPGAGLKIEIAYLNGSGAGVMFEAGDTETMALFQLSGWTLLTAVNLTLFSLLHNPCSTTIYTIYKETGSGKWTAVAALLPLIIGLLVTFTVAQTWRLVSGLL